MIEVIHRRLSRNLADFQNRFAAIQSSDRILSQTKQGVIQVAKQSRGRLRVFFAEFDGDDETIQEGLRAIASAVNKTFQPRVVVKQLPVDGHAHQNLTDESESDIESEETEEDLETVLPAKPKAKSARKPPTMSLVKDLDLCPSKKPHLKSFVAEKNPQSQPEQIAVCVYYLRKILEVDGVTANHVYTCFKDAGFRTPNDLPQIIRNTAAAKGTVDSKGSKGIQITTRGENLVEHDLPKSKKNGD